MKEDMGTFEHTADMGVWGAGDDPGEAILNAARAMFGLAPSDRYEAEAPTVTKSVESEGGSLVELLVETLNEMLSVSDLEGMRVMRISGGVFEHGPPFRLRASMEGAGRMGDGTEEMTEIKAATYHRADVVEDPAGRWTARCVVDL